MKDTDLWQAQHGEQKYLPQRRTHGRAPLIELRGVQLRG